MRTRNVARAVILTAIAVALSPFIFIPVGVAKCYPVQHLVNVLAGVMLGPGYALGMAAVASTIRNMLGLGTPLAFPGSMIGALLAGLAFRYFHNIYLAALGEVVGTGLLGALASVWLVAPMIMGKTMGLTALIIAFSVSSIGGSILALLALRLLRQAGFWQP